MRQKFITVVLLLIGFTGFSLLWGQEDFGGFRRSAAGEANQLYDKAAYNEAGNVATAALAGLTTGDERGALLNTLAKVNFKKGRFAMADSLFRLALSAKEETYGEFSPVCIESLNDRAEMLIELSRFDEAVDLLLKSMEIGKGMRGSGTVEYGKSMALLANCLTFAGMQVEAKDYLTEAEAIYLRVYRRTYPEYADLLIYKGDYDYSLGNYEQALTNYEQAANVYKATWGEQHPDYAESLLAEGAAQGSLGNYRQAEKLLLQAIPVIENYFGKERSNYARALSNLGSIYVQMGDYEAAKPYLEESFEISNRLFEKNDSHYFNALNLLALLYRQLGYYEQAEPLLLRSLELQKAQHGDVSKNASNAMNTLGLFYTEWDKCAEAEKYASGSLAIMRTMADTTSADYADKLSGMASVYACRKNYPAAMTMLNNAASIMKTQTGEDSDRYVQVLHKMLDVEKSFPVKDAAEIERRYVEIAAKEARLYGRNSLNYLITQSELASFYVGNEQFEKAQAINEMILVAAKECPCTHKPEYFTVLCTIARSEQKMGLYAKAQEHFTVAYELILNQLRQDFAFFSEREQDLFRLSQEPNLQSIIDFSAQYSYIDSTASVTGPAYNSELLKKDLQYDSPRHVQQAVLNSGYEQLVTTWKRMQDLRRMQAKPELLNGETVETLHEEMYALDKELIAWSVDYRRLRQQLDAAWQDIQDKLLPNEAAIEFVRLQTAYTDEWQYYALLLRNDGRQPEMVALCAETALKNALSQPASLYSLIWQPLEKQLGAIGEVYIAPAGLLQSVSFAEMPKDGNPLSDTYVIRKVMSTKEIVFPPVGNE